MGFRGCDTERNGHEEPTSNRLIDDYSVRVYIYRSNGRPLGFVTKHESPLTLQPGGRHASVASLADVAIPPDAVVLVIPTTVAFMDEGPRWMAPKDAQERVKAEAARLTVVAMRSQPHTDVAQLVFRGKTGHWGEGITADDMAALRWVKPKIVVEVSFVEWTRDGLLRHPEFIEVREDKSPREIRRERD